MIRPRPLRLRVQILPALTIYGVCLAVAGTAFALPQAQPNSNQQQAPPPQPPAPAPPAGQQPKQQNPFENVPEAPQPQQPQAKNNAGLIDEIQFRGQRRIPQDTLRALILSRKGDVYSDESVHRDFMALWNSGRFDDLRVEKETAPDGGIIVRFIVAERRIVRSIDYTGNKSITKSEILDRFKERKVAIRSGQSAACQEHSSGV
jgi:outer membrane protein insertion porin family